MDYKQYEVDVFDLKSAFSMATGYAGRSYQKHWHSYGQIILVGAGEDNVYKIDQKTYHVSKGDLVFAWPMEMHEIIDADRSEALVIQFGNAFMNSLYDLQKIAYYYRNLHAIKHELHPELSQKLGELVTKMKEIYFLKEMDREIRCCMLLMDFMLVLDEHRDEFETELQRDSGGNYTGDVNRRLITVTDYVKHHLTEDDLSEETMANMAGISKDYFSRIFKNVTGENYAKWLNHVRLESAMGYLTQKSMTLTEVAMLSGFKSLSSFNRVFQKEKGMAPGEYRSLLAKEGA